MFIKYLAFPLSWVKESVHDFFKRRQHFTFDEWVGIDTVDKDGNHVKKQGLIDKVLEKEAKKIKIKTTKVEIEYIFEFNNEKETEI